MRVTIFDYGAGNLHSLGKALRGPGRDVRFESDAGAATDTDVLVLPGVGAFEPAATALEPARFEMRSAIMSGLPCLGICLGMQLLFDASEEGAGAGLGVFRGHVTRLRTPRVPHIGWNAIEDTRDPIFAASHLTTAYYANSFVCRPADDSAVIAWTAHDGDRFPAAVRLGKTIGVQFHPEKSSVAGLAFVNACLSAVTNP